MSTYVQQAQSDHLINKPDLFLNLPRVSEMESREYLLLLVTGFRGCFKYLNCLQQIYNVLLMTKSFIYI